MTKKEKIAFCILEAMILLASFISTLFLNGFSHIMLAYGILMCALYGTVLLTCIMWTYYAIKRKNVTFAIAGIITVLLAFFMLLSITNIFKNLWFNNIVIILSIIDVLYFVIALCIKHFKN